MTTTDAPICHICNKIIPHSDDRVAIERAVNSHWVHIVLWFHTDCFRKESTDYYIPKYKGKCSLTNCFLEQCNESNKYCQAHVNLIEGPLVYKGK